MKGSSSTILWVSAALIVALAVAQAVHYVRLSMKLPADSIPAEIGQSTPVETEAVSISTDDWKSIAFAGRPAAAMGPLSDRFRLAGTFFLYGDSASENSPEERRRAILDDLTANSQQIVQEEDDIAGYRVTRIEQNRVLLFRDGIEYEIALSFSALARAPGGVPGQARSTPPSMEDLPALETSRFGKRVGENRWVMQREELMRYYAEVLDDPERVAHVYASLKPQYNGSEITGYYLNAEGEKEFFDAIGLQEGDVIRRVNSMRMVSQRRAEYFISEFMKNRVNALVFDIERGDQEQKLIYLIR